MPEMNLVTLDRMLPGEGGRVHGYQEPKELHHRLKELGLVEGTHLRVRRCAPLGDPMELSIRGYHLSIRKEDARHILVIRDEEPCGCENRRGHRGGQEWRGKRQISK